MFSFAKRAQSVIFRIAYVIEEDGGSFHAFAPAFKGLHVDGNTKEDAERNLIAAIKVYIDSHARHADPLPVGPGMELLRHQQEPDDVPEIPMGAFLGSLTLEWPSLSTSGIS